MLTCTFVNSRYLPTKENAMDFDPKSHTGPILIGTAGAILFVVSGLINVKRREAAVITARADVAALRLDDSTKNYYLEKLQRRQDAGLYLPGGDYPDDDEIKSILNEAHIRASAAVHQQ